MMKRRYLSRTWWLSDNGIGAALFGLFGIALLWALLGIAMIVYQGFECWR